MTDDDLVKIIQKAVKDEVRPLKENLEVVKNKVGKVELFQDVNNSQIRAIRDQQSVINEKLDGIDDMKKDFGVVKQDLGSVKQNLQKVKDQLNDVNDIIGKRMYPSVIEIENKIAAYADMYKLNNDNSKKLDKRLGVVEDRLDIQPDPELSILDAA